MRYAVLLSALLLGSCAQIEAERQQEQQQRLEVQDAQCRLQGYQEGTQAWADCHTLLTADEAQAAAERRRAACLEQERQDAAQESIDRLTYPYYAKVIRMPCQ